MVAAYIARQYIRHPDRVPGATRQPSLTPRGCRLWPRATARG